MILTKDSDIAALLNGTRTIAMIGASDRPERASNGVMRYLLSQGYHVIPVNPALSGATLFGQTVVASLENIDEPIDMVDIFRNSEAAAESVDSAITVGAKSVWMQLGVINEAAAERAVAAGLSVVMDRCPKIEIARLGVKRPT